MAVISEVPDLAGPTALSVIVFSLFICLHCCYFLYCQSKPETSRLPEVCAICEVDTGKF